MSLDGSNISRRAILAALLAGLIGVQTVSAFAKDDDGGGGGGDDNGGGDNSGPGGDDDDGRDDDRDDDDDDGKKKDDRNKIRDKVKTGKAASLREILALVRQKYPGQVVRVRLNGSTYRIRIIDRSDRLIEVSVNAANRRITAVMGF